MDSEVPLPNETREMYSMKRSFVFAFVLALLLSLQACGDDTSLSVGGNDTGVVVVGTFKWADSSGPGYNLVYDEDGRRGPNGSISGGLIWLDNTYHANEVAFDPKLGTGANARTFAEAFTQQQQQGLAVITLQPGLSISWDGPWRLAHSGTNPTGQPVDSEFLHLVNVEMGNTPNSEFTESSVFEDLYTQNPADKGGGFFGYWLDQDAPLQPGTEIWFNTKEGRQEIVPEQFSGGYVVFVRNATVSY